MDRSDDEDDDDDRVEREVPMARRMMQGYALWKMGKQRASRSGGGALEYFRAALSSNCRASAMPLVPFFAFLCAMWIRKLNL